MKIKSIKTAREAVRKFENLFRFDTPGQKLYVYFQKKRTGETITVMKYPCGIFTQNRREEDGVESGEILLTEDECVKLFYHNRREINKIIELRMGGRQGWKL